VQHTFCFWPATEILHEVAFKGSPLGKSFIPSNLNHITVDTAREFHAKHYTTDRMVLSATGKAHETEDNTV
jgi:predicted Zn-dependent peptidase